MMLEGLDIYNFQNHTVRKLRFSPECTTIIGPSDAGKSGSLRALRWLATNSPGGDSFIRYGTTEVRVIAYVDGRTITRVRGKSINEYMLDDEKFVAFGTDVPEPIKQVLQVGDQNFQDQLDPVFWLQLTAGEVSRQLNNIVDLSIIDKAMGNIAGRVKDASTRVKVLREQGAEAKQARDALAWVVEAQKQYEQVELLRQDFEHRKHRCDRLQELGLAVGDQLTRRDTNQQKLAAIRVVGLLGQAALKLDQRVTRLLTVIRDIYKSQDLLSVGVPDLSSLDQLVQSIQDQWARQNRLRVLVKDAERLQVKARVCTVSFTDLDKARLVYLEISGRQVKLKRLVEAAEVYRERVDRSAAIRDLREAQLAVMGLNEVCPVCGGELK